MKKLYVCECAYVLYKALIERMGDEENSYSLILSDATVDLKPMVPILRQSGLFERVEFFPSELFREYYDLFWLHQSTSRVKRVFSMLKNHLIMLSRQKGFKEIAFPFDLDFKQYDKIICSEGPYVINGHLSVNHMEYAISEHAKDTYQQGSSTAANVFFTVLNLLDAMHIITGMHSSSRFCKEIIVNDAAKTVSYIRHKKVTEWSVNGHIAVLDAQQKDRIFQMYAEAYGLKIDAHQTYDLLLTNQIYRFGLVPSEEKQIEFYKDVIRDHLTYPVLIKPHPMDTVDYRKFFPECIIIDSDISSEVLNFSHKLRLGTVLTLFSSSVSSFHERAKKTVVLEKDNTIFNNRPLESLKDYQ